MFQLDMRIRLVQALSHMRQPGRNGLCVVPDGFSWVVAFGLFRFEDIDCSVGSVVKMNGVARRNQQGSPWPQPPKFCHFVLHELPRFVIGESIRPQKMRGASGGMPP